MFVALRKGTAFNMLARFAMSGGHARPTKLEKIDKKMYARPTLSIWLNVKNVYGAYERVPSFVGESLMTALLRNSTPGFEGTAFE